MCGGGGCREVVYFKNLVPAYQVSRSVRSVAAHPAQQLQLCRTRLLWKDEAGDSWILAAGEAVKEDGSSGSQSLANWAC